MTVFMKKLITTLTFIIVLTSKLLAQAITGTWYGQLDVKGTKLPLVFHIEQSGSGYVTKWDSPNQAANGLPTDKTTFANNQLLIDASQFGIKYNATFLPDSNKFKGTFVQGNTNLPLSLTRNKADVSIDGPPRRPQDPTSFAYKQEEITFANPKAGITLSGTLTMPATGKASKIAVLITGSGPQNRNEEMLNHRPFLVWSDWLTRQGIAVLRYDDRGIDKSTGVFKTATTADFADDAEAAVRYIKSRPDLKSLSIGLIGHSEGGLIAPRVASRNKSVNFIVLLAGPGIPIDQLMLKQGDDQMRLSNAPEAGIQQGNALRKVIYGAMKKYDNLADPAFKQKLDSTTLAYMHRIDTTTVSDSVANKTVRDITDPFNTPWYRYFINIVPATYLSKVKCPVLAINGTLDMQVNSAANLEGIRASLEKAGNKKFEIVPMPGLNHLLQKATTGSLPEYVQIEETVNPAVLQKVSDWITQLPLR